MDPTIMLFIVLLFCIFLFAQSSRAKKRQAKKLAEMEEQLVPGAWVMTTSGFYGRFIDRDGDVVILETNDGTETFWLAQAVRQVVDTPPFGGSEADESPSAEGEAPIADATDAASESDDVTNESGVETADVDAAGAIEASEPEERPAGESKDA